MEREGERAVARTARRELGEEWALVLLAEDLTPALHRSQGRWVVCVPEEQAEQALRILASYARESCPAPPARSKAWSGEAPVAFGLAVAGSLLLFHRIMETSARAGAWLEQGAASARAIREGELWRTVTALTLHADAAHVLGNALAGGLMWTLVGRALGPGLGALAILAAGAGGNLANALLRPGPHESVGASTAVFAAVGLLGGFGGARPAPGVRRLPGWMMGAACLGLLAMLGTGGARTDIWAHGFGLAVGLAVGAGLGRLLPGPPALGGQLLCGGLAAGGVVGCWWLASLAGAGG